MPKQIFRTGMWSVESWGRSRRRRTKCLKMKVEGGGENGTPIVLLRGDGMWGWIRRWRWKWKYEGGVENAGWDSYCFLNLCFHPPPSPLNQRGALFLRAFPLLLILVEIFLVFDWHALEHLPHPKLKEWWNQFNAAFFNFSCNWHLPKFLAFFKRKEKGRETP